MYEMSAHYIQRKDYKCNIGLISAINQVYIVKSRFSANLEDNCNECVSKVYQSYLNFQINVTPKVHAVFFYVPYFCSELQMGLSF